MATMNRHIALSICFVGDIRVVNEERFGRTHWQQPTGIAIHLPA